MGRQNNNNGGSLSKTAKAGVAMREIWRWSDGSCASAGRDHHPSINICEGVDANISIFSTQEGGVLNSRPWLQGRLPCGLRHIFFAGGAYWDLTLFSPNMQNPQHQIGKNSRKYVFCLSCNDPPLSVLECMCNVVCVRQMPIRRLAILPKYTGVFCSCTFNFIFWSGCPRKRSPIKCVCYLWGTRLEEL